MHNSGPSRRIQRLAQRHWRGFTLIEGMVVIAIVAVLLALAAPSMTEMIQMRRLRGITDQLVTDLQFARSEAINRRSFARITFKLDAANSYTCYTIFTSPGRAVRCDCSLGAGLACGPNAVEIRTVVVDRSTGTALSIPVGQSGALGFEPAMGGLVSIPVDIDPVPLAEYKIDAAIDAERTFRIVLKQSGRPSVCRPAGSRVDVGACP